MTNKVICYNISGINAFIFGISIFKINICCGHCKCWFKKRIDFVDLPTIKCPYCNTINILLVQKDHKLKENQHGGI